MLFFFSFVALFFIYSFFSSAKLTRITFFIPFSYFLNWSFWLSSKLSRFAFFLLRSSFLSFFPYLLFLLIIFSRATIRELYVNFKILFTGDFTLLEIVFSFCWSIAYFAFCFSSSRRTDSWIIYSAVFEISSEVELTPAAPFNEFGEATRKLLFFL